MTRFAISLFVLLALVLASPSPSAAPIKEKEKPKTPDYYPLKAGSKWHYKVEADTGTTTTVVVHVAKIEKIDDVPLARLEASIDGSVSMTEHLRSTDKGVFRHRFNGVEASPPLCVLRYPVKKDDSWEQEVKAGKEELKMKSRVGTEDVEVPAGKFKAITVESTGTAGGRMIISTCWYADSVGMVKQVVNLDGLVMTMQLEKYEEGK